MKAPKKKTLKLTKTNTRKKKAPDTVSSDYEDYFDYSIWKTKPMTIEGIDRKAEVLIKWAITNDDALTLVQWYTEQGISGETVKRWVERSDKFANALKIARRAIGSRREIGGLKRIYDSSMVKTSMPQYSKEWKELVEWEASIKRPQEQEKSEAQIVVIDRYLSKKENKE